MKIETFLKHCSAKTFLGQALKPFIFQSVIFTFVLVKFGVKDAQQYFSNEYFVFTTGV